MARLLLERLSRRDSGRAVGVGLKWLLGWLVHGVGALPDHLHVQPVTSDGDVRIRRFAVEADDMASVVPKQANTPWIGIAMDATTRHVLAVHGGIAAAQGARRWGAKMPHAYPEHTTFDPDQSVVKA